MKKGHVSSPNILTWKKGLENKLKFLHNGNQSGFECGFLNSPPLGNTENPSLKGTEGEKCFFNKRNEDTYEIVDLTGIFPHVLYLIYTPTQLIVSRIGAQNVYYCVQLNPQQLYYKFQGDRGVRRKGTLKWVSGSLELTSIQLGENSGSLPNLWKLIFFCRNASASNLGQNMVAVLCHRRGLS